jgi:hypothetical protein
VQNLLVVTQDFEGMAAKKNPNAQALGRLGGRARAEKLPKSVLARIASKGGKARAAKLSAQERTRIAKLAAAARKEKGGERAQS